MREHAIIESLLNNLHWANRNRKEIADDEVKSERFLDELGVEVEKFESACRKAEDWLNNYIDSAVTNAAKALGWSEHAVEVYVFMEFEDGPSEEHFEDFSDCDQNSSSWGARC